MKVILYGLTTCPYCRMTKKMFDEGGIEYELHEVDLLEGEEKAKMVEKIRSISGGTSFPVVIIGEDVIVGFDKRGIKEKLGL